MAKKKMTLEEKLDEAIVKDFPYEVPKNWVWIEIGSIIEVVSGGTPKSNVTEYYENGDIAWITPADLSGYNSIYISNGRRNITKLGLEKSSAKLMPKDSVLMSSRAPIGYVVIADNDICTNQGFKSFLPSPVYMPKYLFYYLKYSKELIESLGSGTTFLEISGAKAKTIPFPIAPLKEQQRIVDKIESLFEKLDKANELIEEARDDFEKRKSAILEKAFKGELTKEWRKENHISSNILELLLNQNNKIKKNFVFSQATELFNLPSEWKWVKLKDCCEKFKYGTSAKSKEDGKIPVLRMGNLQGGKLDWNNLVYTSDEEEIKKYDLKSGDLLFNRTNSPELVGKTSIYEGEREAIYAGYLIRVRTLEDINSKFINYFMNSIFAKHRCMEVKSDGVSQSNINAEKLGDFDIPLAPIKEQVEIVRILDNLLEDESKIEELTDLEEQIELIKKSILAKAFRGQLGTNCEDDESALELLKEILSKE